MRVCWLVPDNNSYGAKRAPLAKPYAIYLMVEGAMHHRTHA